MNSKTPNRDILNELGYDESEVFETPDYDSAIIGVDTNDRVVYDYEKMVEDLMKDGNMTYEDAVDFIEYNTIRAMPYHPQGPIVVHPIDIYDSIKRVEYKFNPKVERENIVKWIQGWFDKNGKGCNAIIGLSGGKDSTIAAALCAEALGPERVIGVAMPDNNQGVNEADKIAEYLGIKFMIAPIGGFTSEFNGSMWHHFGDEDFKWSEQSIQNIPPRVRMTMLYAISQTFNGRVVGTCNLSENYIGYMTRWGDQASDFEPLGELTVTEVRAIGHELGIPAKWVDKIPDDGLPNSSPDEEKFGFSYEVLDKYIRFGECDDAEIKAKIDARHFKNLFKLNPQPMYIPDLWQ